MNSPVHFVGTSSPSPKKLTKKLTFLFLYNGAATNPPAPGQMHIFFYVCPHCKEVTILATVDNDEQLGVIPIRPLSFAKKYPSYIPESIRNDYEEACAIAKLSPKASATLSRRCLQGMIRDFWGISKSRLIDEIDLLHDKVPAAQWKVIDAVRRIGNIGAHMEKDINLIVDIDSGEANKLLKLIELLIEQWYINRHEQEMLFSEILDIDASKQAIRKKV